MRNWVDVQPGDWFYNEVMEATNTLMEDSKSLVEGIPYNSFEEGAPFLYEEQVAVDKQTYFSLSSLIEPTNDNPLFVHVDGTQTIYKALYTNDQGNTDVELYVGVAEGQIVSFSSYGIPAVDSWGKPELLTAGVLPSIALEDGASYVYIPFSRSRQEYVYAHGRMLKRAYIPDKQWGYFSETHVVKEFLAGKLDSYVIAPSGTFYAPFNLNNVTCLVNYWVVVDDIYQMRSAEVKPTSASVEYNNMFFPNAVMTRAEAFALIDRLRKTFYSRFTDLDAPGFSLNQTIKAYSGQKVFRLNGNYPAGKKQSIVKVNGATKTVDTDYIEFDDHTILMTTPLNQEDTFFFSYSRTTSQRFEDVGKVAGYYDQGNDTETTWGIDEWWVSSVLALEGETFSNEEYFIQGFDVDRFNESGLAVVDEWGRPLEGGMQPVKSWFMPYTALTRAESAAILNRLRKWVIERFK